MAFAAIRDRVPMQYLRWASLLNHLPHFGHLPMRLFHVHQAHVLATAHTALKDAFVKGGKQYSSIDSTYRARCLC